MSDRERQEALNAECDAWAFRVAVRLRNSGVIVPSEAMHVLHNEFFEAVKVGQQDAKHVLREVETE